MQLGASRQAIRTRRETGRWDQLYSGIYRLAGTAPGFQQSLVAVTLSIPGALASHRAGAVLWDMPGVEHDVLEITVPRGLRRRYPDVVIHEASVPRWERTTKQGIAVTTPARMVLELASVVPFDRMEEVLDDALRRRLVTVPRLQARLERYAVRGRPGVQAMRALLNERDPSKRPPDSVFERRLFRELRTGGLPLPVGQFDVFDGGRFVMRLDYAYPDARVGIEADSWRHHSGRRAWERDFTKRDAVMLMDWLVVHVTWRQLVAQPEKVVERVAGALALAARRR